MDDGFTDRCNRYSAKRRILGTSLTNRTPFIAVRSRNAGSTGRGVEKMLAPFPRNPTWSSLAYKASAVASGSKGAFVSSLRFFASG